MQTAKVVGKGRPLLVDQVMGLLSDYIRREGLSPGDRLPSEADLAERMQCSRNVLREAVGRMTSLGLVDVRRGSGMFVGTTYSVRSCVLLLRSSLAISVNDLVEFTEFRRALEGYAARQATSKATDVELSELDAMANQPIFRPTFLGRRKATFGLAPECRKTFGVLVACANRPSYVAFWPRPLQT
jgi:DNA-binding FadR family transcriptional regulator